MLRSGREARSRRSPVLHALGNAFGTERAAGVAGQVLKTAVQTKAAVDDNMASALGLPSRTEVEALRRQLDASVCARVAAGTRWGQAVIRLSRPSRAETLPPSPSFAAAVLGGFSLHAGVAMGEGDRGGLERLCRYVARPPLAEQRLEEMADGRIVYRLRHRWRDGTSAVVLEPRDLLARLAPQILPPRMHHVRYHGVLGPCALWRRYVVASAGGAAVEAPVPCGERPDGSGGADSPPRTRDPSGAGRARRMAWSELLRRVLAVDALRCQRCGGAMRIVAAVCEPRAVAAFLACIRKGAGRPPP